MQVVLQARKEIGRKNRKQPDYFEDWTVFRKKSFHATENHSINLQKPTLFIVRLVILYIFGSICVYWKNQSLSFMLNFYSMLCNCISINIYSMYNNDDIHREFLRENKTANTLLHRS